MSAILAAMTENDIDEGQIQKAGEIIRSGGLVAFPTETVYGLGGDALDASSSEKIYAAKGRPSDNPLIVHIADMEDLYKIAEDIPDEAEKLAESYWPGPLTMIFRKKDIVPKATTGGLETVAVRFPSNIIAQRLIKASGGFIAAPSANISGRPSPTSASHVIKDLADRVDMIIDGGDCAIGLESTIVDFTSDVPAVLRPGYIGEKELKRILSSVVSGEHLKAGEAPKAPGMKYRHYSPKGDVVIVSGAPEKVSERIREMIRERAEKGGRCAVLCAAENAGLYEGLHVYILGSRNDPEEIAGSLYRLLRLMDDEKMDFICSEGFPETGIFYAVMNRLKKAAGQNIIYV